ncbi:MAG: ABC transporter permease [Gemmataceae bacterium]|nr:ABC transporter permease [Gemmataceae bacterium]
MTFVLVRKILRDLRLGLFVTLTLVFLFQMLWARVTARIVGHLIQQFGQLGFGIDQLKKIAFEGEGRVIETLIGGEGVSIDRATDMMSVALVHPMTQLILCIWAVGRASGAIAGEIDRGTMELLLSQPIRRTQVILAHFLVDCVAIPLICVLMWSGIWFGTWLLGFQSAANPKLFVDPYRFLLAMPSVAGLLFAVGGLTMWVSAAGRSRTRVLGFAVLVILLQFLINVIGQMWPPMEAWRPWTIFRWYQPQAIVLNGSGLSNRETYLSWGILFGIGLLGWTLATLRFRRRDLPAPL